MKTTIYFSFILFLFFLSGCNEILGPKINGSGNIITEQRSLSAFTKIILEGSYEVELLKDEEHMLVIEADNNILPFIKTENSGDILRIDYGDNYRINPSRRVKIRISTDILESISIRGSADLESANYFEGEHLAIDISGSGSARFSGDYEEIKSNISGSGEIFLDGQANFQTVDIAGSGNYLAQNLTSQNANLKISGSGSMKVDVQEYLKVNISGSGNIYYTGHPQIETNISGSGNIMKQ